MTQTHVLTALAIFAVTGSVNYSHSPAEAWQANVIKNFNEMMTKATNANDYQHRGRPKQELIHKVGADAYPGASGADMRSGAVYSHGSIQGDNSRNTGEYKSGSLNNESRYGTNPSNNYFQ